MNRLRRLFIAIATAFVAIPSAQSQVQKIDWNTELRFYGDNTEFTDPYREGETLLGVQVRTWLELELGKNARVLVGGWVDKRSADEEFVDDSQPVLSLHLQSGASRFVLGTLENGGWHGLIEPLAVTTLQFTRPVEQGIQWLRRTPRTDLDAFLNWQKLNTPEHREVFDYGLLYSIRATENFAAEFQIHGLHHGGQLFSTGRVYNNLAFGPGVKVGVYRPWVTGSLRLFHLMSTTSSDPLYPERPTEGSGTYARLDLTSVRASMSAFAIAWRGEDFFSDEGDRNYGSVGNESDFYRSDREYGEIGVAKHFPFNQSVYVSLEVRLHFIDEDSPEYSFRFLARVPITFTILPGARRAAR